MSSLLKIYKGEDADILLTITDVNGDPVDLGGAGVSGLLVFLYTKKDEIAAQFSLNTQVDFTDLIAVNLAGGQVSAPLNSSVTKTLTEDVLKAEIKVQFVDANFENSTFWDVVSDVPVAQITNAVSKKSESFS